MEVAGVVLGGIPLLLYALDNYKRCLEPGKDYWRYASTLCAIRSHVFVQQEQLDVTLRNIGLVKPTRTELEQHLRELYPKSKCSEFLSIVDNMEKTVGHMMEKLDIDADGKPRWTTDVEERAQWEWRRIRRSLGRKEREQLVAELQYWNTALKNIFEKIEIPLAESDPILDEIQARFNAAHCDKARKNFRHMHDVLAQRWGCSCPEHGGNIRIDWHTTKILPTDKLTLVIPSDGSHNWHQVTVNFQAVDEDNEVQSIASSSNISAAATTSTVTTTSTAATSRQPSPSLKSSTSLSKKMKGFFKPSSSQKNVTSPHFLAPPPAPAVATDEFSNIQREISCLCGYIKSAKENNSGYLHCPGVHDRHLMVNLLPSTPRQMKSISLQSLLGSRRPKNSSTQFQLSRKHRFSVAAAAAWALLYLCESPWMENQWSGKDQIHFFSEEASTLQGLAEHPTFQYIFRSIGNATLPKEGSNLSGETERFQSKQIINKDLFSLGILLIELCLNTTFEQIRHESQMDNFSTSLDIPSSAVDDFEIATQQTDRIYLDAGDSYGYAVQRCLRCEFPGRDVTKSFDFRQFRQHFFTGVVAPVQATYLMQP
ncbi:hypothetical protein B0J13DRAFT_549043 [Dactylonectria estremocensis]|uniref:DUF7580 domain-containing protein n=1 Tax=Dactylonectria estremocensis TaxID=1079267 RepID=A0A9P9F0K6_9HYPO|nr:hypothetical protein B0J13DRAFT_549043 [Dactylonectria estremocensis]